LEKIALVYTLVGSKEEATNLAKGLIRLLLLPLIRLFLLQKN
jgi:hypothetical protein